MPICVYCNQEKNEEEFSQEHVIPKAIGGNIEPVNPFTLYNVCKRCNSLCGTYIDGPFIKNWLVQNQRTDAIRKYANITKRPVLPLRYMGRYDEIKFENNICEFWLGPTGDRIYHFHKPYPEEPFVAPMTGVPTFVRKDEIDPGFVFLFIRSNNPVWHPTIGYSFIAQFKGSMLFLGNSPTPSGGVFVLDIPLELKNLHLQLYNMAGQKHRTSFEIGIYYGDRFLAKVGLGIGALLLNNSFITSNSAQLLRTFMWTKDPTQREKIPIGGKSFFEGYSFDKELKQIVNWPGGHIIALIKTGRMLNMYSSFYETQCDVLRISIEPEHWAGKINEGIVFVISPGLQRCVGPKNIGTYIAHRVESDFKDPDLSALEEVMRNTPELPPFDI